MSPGRPNLLLKCLAASTLTLALTACGNNSSNSAAAPPVLSASALTGKYTFTVNGTNPADGDYTIAGSFTADGKGAITSAVADYNLGSGIDSNVQLTGTYTASAGIARLTLTDSASLTDSYNIQLVAGGPSVIAKSDGTGSGNVYPALAAAFTPAGTYTYALKGEEEGVVNISGGFVAATNGTFASGTESFTDGAVLMKYASLTGFLYPVQANGRGQAAIGGNNFSYYPATANQIVLVGLDDRALLQGTAQKQ